MNQIVRQPLGNNKNHHPVSLCQYPQSGLDSNVHKVARKKQVVPQHRHGSSGKLKIFNRKGANKTNQMVQITQVAAKIYLYVPSGCLEAAFIKKAAVRHLRNRSISSPHEVI